MASTASATDQLRKGDKVVARTDLRDVPEGTTGKVSMVTGLSWIRYWVRFDNTVSLGTVDRTKLATPEEWERHLAGDDEVATATDGEEGPGTDDEAGGDAGGAGAATPSGTVVPQKLLDRSVAARARLSGS